MEELILTEQKTDHDQEFQNSELINAIIYNNQRDFWLTEYQCIISQFTKYVGLYFLVFVVYLGIQGFLLIGIFDFLSDIRMIVLIFSICCCLLFFACTSVAWATVGNLSKRKIKALSELGIREDEVTDEFSIGKSTTYVYVAFNIMLFLILCILFIIFYFKLIAI